jgi:hypothetical protein
MGIRLRESGLGKKGRFKGPKVQGFKEIEPTVDTRQPTADRKRCLHGILNSDIQK